MFELNDKRYELIRITRAYKGRLTITRETTINPAADCLAVMQILARPEKYEGERQEAINELSECGCTVYRHIMISELPASWNPA